MVLARAPGQLPIAIAGRAEQGGAYGCMLQLHRLPDRPMTELRGIYVESSRACLISYQQGGRP